MRFSLLPGVPRAPRTALLLPLCASVSPSAPPPSCPGAGPILLRTLGSPSPRTLLTRARCRGGAEPSPQQHPRGPQPLQGPGDGRGPVGATPFGSAPTVGARGSPRTRPLSKSPRPDAARGCRRTKSSSRRSGPGYGAISPSPRRQLPQERADKGTTCWALSPLPSLSLSLSSFCSAFSLFFPPSLARGAGAAEAVAVPSVP